jgi:hypothetical protein
VTVRKNGDKNHNTRSLVVKVVEKVGVIAPEVSTREREGTEAGVSYEGGVEKSESPIRSL